MLLYNMVDTFEIHKDVYKNGNGDLENIDTEYLKKMQDAIEGKGMPDDFDTWTVQEQRDWTYQNIIPFFSNVPESLQDFIPAFYRHPNNNRPLEKLPEWMDMDKYRRAQKFVRDHYFSIVVAKLFGLIYACSFDDGRKTLLLGGNSHTPYLAFKKHITSIRWMLSWFTGEPWVKGTEAHRVMQITRTRHLALNKKAESLSNEQFDTVMKFKNPWSLDYELLLKDLAMTCPSEKFGQRPYKMLKKSKYRTKGINNAFLAAIQGSFVLLPICYPENIGLHEMSDEDLEAYVHMWKCYGYFIGIEDEYNFCRGSFKEVKQRAWDLAQYWIKVNLKEIEPEWVHITRCQVASVNYYPLLYFPYKIAALIFTEALNLKMPYLYASLNYREWIGYKFYKFIFGYALKFSITRGIINRIIYKMLETASNFGAEKLAKLHEHSKQQLPDFSIL